MFYFIDDEGVTDKLTDLHTVLSVLAHILLYHSCTEIAARSCVSPTCDGFSLGIRRAFLILEEILTMKSLEMKLARLLSDHIHQNSRIEKYLHI